MTRVKGTAVGQVDRFRWGRTLHAEATKCCPLPHHAVTCSQWPLKPVDTEILQHFPKVSSLGQPVKSGELVSLSSHPKVTKP
jgi:hypothetical protein